MVHGGTDHVVGAVNADNVRIGVIGIDDRILVLAISLIAQAAVCEVGMWPVNIVIVSIPVHTGLTAGFFQAAEGRHNAAILQQLVNVNEAGST